MAFPSPSLSPPALSLYQWSYGGLVFGGVAPDSVYQLQSVTIDMPDVAAGDVQRAMDQGEFAGVDVLPGADVTLVQVISTPGLPRSQAPSSAQAAAIDQACQALGGVFGPGGTLEAPLYFQMASGCYARMARPRKHNCPWDANRAFAGGAVATTMLHCTDPRWYAAPTRSATVGLPAPAGGLAPFPVSFPLSFGSGGAAGILNVTNGGFFESRPVLVITGPCTNPIVSNLSIAGAPFIGVAISLAAGDTLTIDTDFQSVLYTAVGTTQAVSRRNALMSSSTWFNLQPSQGPHGLAGPNVIEFATSDPAPVAGMLTVQSGDAYLTL